MKKPINILLSTFIIITYLLSTPVYSFAETSPYRSAGWVATDGSPAYSNTTGCQLSNDGQYCSRPLSSSNANLYFSSFGTLSDFGIPQEADITKLHIRVNGRNAVNQLIGVAIGKNRVAFSNACQLPTDLWRANFGNVFSTREFHTFTSDNGLSNCVNANNVNLERLTFVMNYADVSPWSADIDNFEVAFDYTLPSAQWKNTGHLNIKRFGHTATVLNNGKVLVVGGERDGLRVWQAEIYDPISRTWSQVRQPSDVRKDHEAHLVTLDSSSEKTAVLIFGGLDSGSYTNRAELYDPISNIWSIAPNMNYKRLQHSSSILIDGRVLVTGGFNPTPLNTTEIYNPILNTWSAAQPLNIVRRSHSQVTFKDINGNSKVMVMGGADGAGNLLRSTEIYDPINDTWVMGPSMNITRVDFSSVILPDGRILVAGGNSNIDTTSEVYNPKDSSWTIYNANSAFRYGNAMALAGGGADKKVLVAGGSSSNDAKLFDPKTNSWTNITPMNSPRARFTLSTLLDGSILAASGIAVYSQTVTSEIYSIGQVLGDATGPEPFLDLPWDYKNERNHAGRKSLTSHEAATAINSYFDHTYPLLSSGISEPLTTINLLQNYNSRNQVTTFKNENSSSFSYSSHDGYDYGKKAQVYDGDPVYAAAGGTVEVELESTSGGAGNVVKIDHGNGYQTWYEHLYPTGLAESGSTVKKGDQIGLVGHTGNCYIETVSGQRIMNTPDCAHIHFSVIQDKDKDNNFANNVPDGMTDPYGWQRELNYAPELKSIDPWEVYEFNQSGIAKKGNKSFYLWNNKLNYIVDYIGQEVEANIGGANFKFPAGVHAKKFTADLNSSPQVEVTISGKKYRSIGPTIQASARDVLGNIIDAFLLAFRLTIDIKETALYNVDTSTLSIYSSNDGVTWQKEETSIDLENGKATANIDHFSYFALMAEVLDVTAPITQPDLSGEQGENGWYRSNVDLVLNTIDNTGGVGVEHTYYKVGEGEWTKYSLPLIFDKEGKYEVSIYSSDLVSNYEDRKIIKFTIDKTAPEAGLGYDIEKQEIVVSGNDSHFSSVTEKDTFENKREIILSDKAGNTLTLAVKDKVKGKNARLTINAIKYNEESWIYIEDNKLFIQYVDSTDTIKTFNQTWQAGEVIKVKSSYSSKLDLTEFTILNADGTIQKETVGGIKLLQLITENGTVKYSY